MQRPWRGPPLGGTKASCSLTVCAASQPLQQGCFSHSRDPSLTHQTGRSINQGNRAAIRLSHVQAVEEAQAGNLREQWDFMDSLAAANEHSSLGRPLSPHSNGQHSSGGEA